MKYLILSIIWVGYCFLHSFLISIRFTNIITRLLKNYYAFYRLLYVLISLVLLVLEFGDTYVKYQQEVPMLIPFTKTNK